MASHRQDKQRSAAVGGKTARACDSCIHRRARWYCAADDAFLCQGCDASVHSANLLARRHHRLRLNTSSSAAAAALTTDPAWHHGIKRKARTPRPHHSSKPSSPPSRLHRVAVPELEMSSADENSEEEAAAALEEESQILYRVPVFDPILAELFSPPPDEECKPAGCTPPAAATCGGRGAVDATTGSFSGLFPSDKELVEFAADMESLLGRGLGDDTFSMEELGLVDSRVVKDCCGLPQEEGRVKVEDMVGDDCTACDADGEMDIGMDLSRETLDLDFGCGSPATGEEPEEEEDCKVAADVATYHSGKRMSLRLDYEAVISEWSAQGSSPWTDGKRPQLGPDGCWPDYMGMWSGSGGGGPGMGGDGGREARVTRYREKRRTRLFSKKIRYEVRKLNAEKRPRMKGRFVKRASFGGAAPEPTFVY